VATAISDGKPPAVATAISDGKPPAVATPTPDGKPPAMATPTPDSKPPAAAMPPADGKSPVVATPPAEPPAPMGMLTGTEVTAPVDAATDRQAPKPQDVALPNAVTPTQTGATGDVEKPAQTAAPLHSANGSAAGIRPGPEPQPPEGAVIPEGGPPAKVAIPAPPPPLRVPGKSADWREDRRPDRQQESTLEVIRSRGRWRAFGVGMMVLVVGIVAVLAAWRFVPGLLPAELRPAELMMSLGIEPTRSGPMIKPAPAESQFDE
jgi:hypothetical protein